MAVDTILVSLIGTGAISWLYYANRLQQLPLGVVGAAISVALLPVLSKYLKAGDLENARNTQDKAVEYGLILSFPAAVLLIVLADQIVKLLFQHGRFLSADTTMTANAVIAYSVGLPLYVMTKALMPNFFARGDTITPVKYSAVVFVTNLVFNIVLMQFYGHVGIAMATTIAAFVSLLQYIIGLKKRNYWSFKKPLIVKMFKIMAVSVLMGIFVFAVNLLVLYCFPNYAEHKLTLLAVLGFLGIIALAFFLIAAKMCAIVDYRDFLQMMRRKHDKV